jgi:beta-lactamase class A
MIVFANRGRQPRVTAGCWRRTCKEGQDGQYGAIPTATDVMSDTKFEREVLDLAEAARAKQVGVAFYDYEHSEYWEVHGDVWFHAASTIKVPVLLGVFDAIEQGRFQPHSRVHVRNRFLSIVDGSPYSVESERDANAVVHNAIGKMLPIRELAWHMITTSSNLATNLLLDIVGIEQVQDTLDRLGLDGIELRRGVEDIRAWEEGLNNRVTANGLLKALRAIEEKKAITAAASEEMLVILNGQEFNRGIPAGLPDGARVAHKTGEMSTVAHDAGIIYLESREPYVLVVLTEWAPQEGKRQDTIASISRAVYRRVSESTGDARESEKVHA